MKRLYSLFARERGTKRWVRVSLASMTLQAARRFYQDRMLFPYTHGMVGCKEYRIRPVSVSDSKAERQRSYLSAI